MGIFDSFFNPQRGYDKAGKEYEKHFNQAQGQLDPYNQQGQQQFQRLMDQANKLNDPAALQAEWAKSYETSPAAQQAMEGAKQTGMEEASQMGLMGSSAAVGNIQKTAGDIASKDREKYMNDLMQKYMTSIGVGQNLYGTGANAAGQMSQNSMNQGQNMAGAAFGKQNAPGEMFGNILGMGTNLGMNWLTGGRK